MAKFKTDKLRDLSLARASRAGFSILDCQKHPQPLLASIKHLKEGKALVIECDETESWHPHRDKRGQFLGCSILVDKTIDLMVKRTNCSVFTAFVHRNGNRQYQLDLKKIDHAIDGKGIGELSMKALEEYIYANPEQWYLWNRFDEMLVDYGATECESTELSSTILGSLFAYK